MPLKRFMVFGISIYGPDGGWNDFLDCFDTYDEAKAFVRERYKRYGHDTYQIVDSQTRIVYT